MNLLSSIRKFVQRWSAKDRIRLSPTEGSWLRLQVDDGVLVREMLFSVINRSTILSETTSQVTFKLRRLDERSHVDAVLRVELAGTSLRFLSASLAMREELIELFEEDPVIVSCSTLAENA